MGEATPEELDSWIDALTRSTGPGDDAARVRMLTQLERLTSAADGFKAVVTAAFSRSQRQTCRLPEKAERVERSIAVQVGMARRESPHRGARRVGLAMVLTTEMPHTLAALRTGRIDEWRATVIVRETATVSREDRGKIDARIGAEIDRLETVSVRCLEKEVRARAYEADREVFVRAREQAVKDRRVSLRPLPGGMVRLSATVPLVEGVAAYATLVRAAATAAASGDKRSRGAVMVDTLLDRVIHGVVPAGPGARCVNVPAAKAPVVPIAVNLVVSDATLLAGGDEPAQCGEFGPIPADLARELVLAADGEGLLTLRRVYANPTGIVAMESRSRCFPPGVARLIRTRDHTCRMPYCDAPVRHIDHITPVADGGATTATHGQGLCEGCNHAKQVVGWSTRVVDDRTGRHTVETITPTGRVYRSTAPPPPRCLESTG
ncbi:HNH endonuclease [Millisia brevis]|uniref:HNH endonuclease n=1 Tax=Millisia brevis TaxID=264148 RepID=UPI000837A7AB|nr:HNH endonuclease signature motif containing protein [Millisia brevis]